MKKTFFFVVVLFLLSFSGYVFGQQAITGTVMDKTGETLPGVTVTVKGQTAGTNTDFNGNFSISVNSAAQTLVFSYLGYEKQEINLNTQNRSKPMTVVMSEISNMLDEVFVIGYQDIRRRDLTGSVGKANLDDMLKAPVASFDQALAGRVAGVNVSSGEGMPGGKMNIVIRGNSSLTQDNSPLYIIDGFPVEDATVASSINPNDIESIDIMKDASATAIYGSRGANGVVIITTKKGTAGALRISYDGSFGVHRITRKIPMMDAYEFIKLQTEIWSASELISDYGYFATVNAGDPSEKTWGLEDYRNIDQYDWQDLVFRDAAQQNHSVSLTGGTQDLRYNASVSYFDQDGIVLRSNYNRIQGRFGANVRKNKLDINLSTNFSQATTLGSSPSQSEYSGMNNLFYSVWGYRPVTQPSLNLNALLNNTVDEGLNATNDYRFNPILSLNNEYRQNMTTYNQYNGYVAYEFMKGLKLKISGGYTIDSRRGENFNNSKTRYGSPVSTDKVNAVLSTSERKTWLNENILTYQTNINRVHAINSMAGMSLQESRYDFYSMRTINIPNESLGMAGMDQGLPSTTDSRIREWSMMSFFGRLNYNYKSKYYLTASFRADGSSKFAKGNRFGYFPSASLAWTFTEEEFMESIKSILWSGKLRASWGLTGNNRVGEYDTYALLNMPSGSSSSDYNKIETIIHGVYPYDDTVNHTGAVPVSLPNKDLKWETTTQTNIGLDLSFLNERVDLTVDWYRKETTDLLLLAALVPSSGYGSAMKNIGKVRNEGWEFTLNTTNIKRKNFVWSTNFNISFNKNRVLELAENQLSMLTNAYFDQNYTAPNYIAKIGYPIGMMYGYVYEGTYKPDEFNFDGSVYTLKAGLPEFTSEKGKTQPGYPKYADVNKDGVIDSNDMTMIGCGDPLHIGGFTNNFEFHNFDLSVFFQWSYGNDVINANRLFFESSFNKKRDLNQYASYSDRFILSDPSTHNSDIPVVGTAGSNMVISSRIVEDGSYLRLKTVSLGYTIDPKITKKAKIDKARFYVSGQNLFTLTNYSGYDPEVSIRNTALTPGLDFSAYPRSMSFNMGVNLNF